MNENAMMLFLSIEKYMTVLFQEKLLTKSLQKGDDQQFDQVSSLAYSSLNPYHTKYLK
jgi:hypothetical protein